MQKILLGTILGILTLSGCSLSTDNSKNQEEVTQELDSKIVTENPKKPYRSETAIKNGEVVDVHGKISNLDKFENFIKHIESGDKDTIRITSYTIEGDPIFYNLIYDGKQIQYTYDNSQDAYGASNKGTKSTSCSKIETKGIDNGVEYHLGGCSSDVGNTFSFTVPK